MKRIIISLGIVSVVAAIAIGATVAYFSNTETSAGNTFIAGAIDLKIDSECHFNGRVCAEGFWSGTQELCSCTWAPTDLDGELFFNFNDVKPGDIGEDTISLHVDTNPAWVCAEISNVIAAENGCNAPEAKVDKTCEPTETNTGELLSSLRFSIWMDEDCENDYDPGIDQYLIQDATASDVQWPIADSTTGEGPIEDACIGIAWSVPAAVGNEIQGDSVTGDITFKAYQARNNDNFVCYSDCGNGVVEPGEECDGLAPEHYACIECKLVLQPYCGNGTLDPGEACEGTQTQTCQAAGGYAGQQTCSDCQWGECRPTEWCGDGTVNDSETCDEGALNGTPNHCNAACTGQTESVCGNSIIESGEQCDDGNTTPLDGCSATCTKEPTITIHKDVENNGVGTKTAGDFQMTIDDKDAAQDTAIYVSAGSHTISEANTFGYDKTYSTSCPAGAVNLTDDQDITCTVTNTMPYGTITVTKQVTNDDGGSLTAGSFTLKVDGSTVTSGSAKNVAVGAHTVSEVGVFGYQATISGNCSSSGSVTVAAGEAKSCTITNNDIAPSIELVKKVVGGSADPDDFDVSIDGNIVTSGSSNSVTANTAHVIDEEASVSGYSFTSITGTSFKGVSCPAALNGTITLLPGDVVTCTITNTHNP